MSSKINSVGENQMACGDFVVVKKENDEHDDEILCQVLSFKTIPPKNPPTKQSLNQPKSEAKKQKVNRNRGNHVRNVLSSRR